MAKRKKFVRKRLNIIFVVIIGIGVILSGFWLNKILQKSSEEPKTLTQQSTPTNLSPSITDIDKNTKKITVPQYRLSFQLPAQYLVKNLYDYKTSIDIFLTSPDRKDKENGETISGVVGGISIYAGWDGFSNERPGNKPYWNMFVVDNSFLPVDNPLVTSETARGYTEKSPNPKIEVKLLTEKLIGYNTRFAITCYDISENRCPQIEKMILSTLKIEQ